MGGAGIVEILAVLVVGYLAVYGLVVIIGQSVTRARKEARVVPMPSRSLTMEELGTAEEQDSREAPIRPREEPGVIRQEDLILRSTKNQPMFGEKLNPRRTTNRHSEHKSEYKS